MAVGKEKEPMKQYVKRSLVALIIVSCLFALGIGTWYCVFNPRRFMLKSVADYTAFQTVSTKSEAEREMNDILNHIKSRHPKCMDGLPAEVAAQRDTEVAAFGSTVSVMELWQAASRCVALLGDSHTFVRAFEETPNVLPHGTFQMKHGVLTFGEGEHKGKKIRSIGGVDTHALFQNYKKQYFHDMDGAAELDFALDIHEDFRLRCLGAAFEGNRVEIIYEEGGGSAAAVYTYLPYEKTSDTSANEKPRFVSYTVDSQNSIAIFTLQSCVNNEEYKQTVQDFFADVREQQIQTVAIDLRANGGGDSGVASEFLRYVDVDSYIGYGRYAIRYGPYLKKVDEQSVFQNSGYGETRYRGDLYILTSPATFSAASSFTEIMVDNGLGKIIGETAGGVPTCYTEVVAFQTPKVKLYFQLSIKACKRIDESKLQEPLTPDYPVDAEDAVAQLYAICGKSLPE